MQRWMRKTLSTRMPWRSLCTLLLLLPAIASAAPKKKEASQPAASQAGTTAAKLERLPYNSPGQVVDLGVGLWAWPLPMDYDGDGDLDLIVSCPDKPYNGTYLFENTSKDALLPVFKEGVKIGPGMSNVSSSLVNGQTRVLVPGHEIPNFTRDFASAFRSGQRFTKEPIYPKTLIHRYKKIPKVRANQWKYADYDGDGDLDVIVGIGDWEEYGWDNAFDADGNWTNGPLHGYVYLLTNNGSNDKPEYVESGRLVADGKEIDVFGMPSPNLADFDGDGDLDLLCGEFLDGFTYFQNVGSRTKPEYAAGVRLPQKMHLEMIVPTVVDWDRDGHPDLIVGQEDGRVALMRHTGKVKDGIPQFADPVFFKQHAGDVKFGALVTPVSFDWDQDGREDLVCGNTAGEIGWIRNRGGDPTPMWDAPRLLTVDGKPIHLQAGPNGSIQGPAEAKWGYTTLSVADWDGDGRADLVVNSIWGKPLWYRNVGKPGRPKLAAAQPIEVEWESAAPKPAWNWWNPQGKELATQWRTTPFAVDWNKDGLVDLVMLDHEGYLAFFERAQRDGKRVLLPGKRIFVDEKGNPLLLSGGSAGKSGRRKFTLADWDGDGRLDLLINDKNAMLYHNESQEKDRVVFKKQGLADGRILAGHDTSPTVATWKMGLENKPQRFLVVGAEDGYFYAMPTPHQPTESTQPAAANPKAEASPATAASPVVLEEFIYNNAPYPECHASTIEATPQGLQAAWFGGTKEAATDVGIWHTRYENGKWTTPVEVADGKRAGFRQMSSYNPVLFQMPDGPLYLFYKIGMNPQSWLGLVKTSTDGGSSWTDPETLPAGIVGPVKNKPILLENKTLLCPSSTEHAGWRVDFELMKALDKPWSIVAPAEQIPEVDAIQPTILRLADGRLRALSRTKRLGKIVQCDGNAEGTSWSKLVPTNLPNPNSGIDAVTLKDGTHLLVYNHTPRGRSPLNVAISKDGDHWEAALVLESQPGEYSYPAVIQSPDGLVHIVYTWNRRKIRHVVLDPSKLHGVPIVDGNWPAEVGTAKSKP